MGESSKVQGRSVFPENIAEGEELNDDEEGLQDRAVGYA